MGSIRDTVISAVRALPGGPGAVAAAVATSMATDESAEEAAANSAVTSAVTNFVEAQSEAAVDYAKEQTSALRDEMKDRFTQGKEAAEDFIENAIDELTESLGLTGLLSGAGQGSSKVRSTIDERTINHQCYLLARLPELTAAKKTREAKHPKQLPYYVPQAPSEEYGRCLEAGDDAGADCPPPYQVQNACLQADSEPFSFMNILTQSPSQGVLFDLTPAEISNLQPMIRLYKVVTDKESGQEAEKEIYFDSYTKQKDLEAMFQNKKMRGFGVGIRDFQFTYDGNNPFAAKKSIKAELTIFSNTIGELFTDRGGYRYADLALKTGKPAAIEPPPEELPNLDAATDYIKKATEEALENLDALRFRLKAVVGWAPPKDNALAADRHNAVTNCTVTLNLTPVTHAFKLDEQGRVIFNISYLAYVDEFYANSKYSVFTRPDVEVARIVRKLQLRKAQQDCDTAKIDGLKRAEGELVEKENRLCLTSLVDRLYQRKSIKWLSLKQQDVDGLKEEGLAYKFEEPLQVLSSAPSSLNNKVPLSFVYMSDLLDAILEGIETSLDMTRYLLAQAGPAELKVDAFDLAVEVSNLTRLAAQFRKFRILLGPIELRNPTASDVTQKFQIVNLGDMPISIQYLNEWLALSFLKSGRSVYPLSTFCTDLFNQLVRGFLNDSGCFGDPDADERTTLNQAVITSYGDEPTEDAPAPLDSITRLLLKPSLWPSSPKYRTGKWASRLPLSEALIRGPALRINPPGTKTDPAKEIHYLTFFVGRATPSDLMLGQKHSSTTEVDGQKVTVRGDHDRGIFHYSIGQERGIVKTISLSKTDSKFLREVRFEQEGYEGLAQLREVYDVNVTTFPNVRVFPGTYIYVVPEGFDPANMEDLTRIGIGGYCMVIRATTRLGPGLAETQLTAKWVAAKQAATIADLPSNVGSAKCAATLSERHQSTSMANIFGGGGDFNILDEIFETGSELFNNLTDSVSSWVSDKLS